MRGGWIFKEILMTNSPWIDAVGITAAEFAANSVKLVTENIWVDGFGNEVVGVHSPTLDCLRFGCSIHNPTDPRDDWPQLWRGDRYLMERICPHGVGHPDKDHLSFIKRTYGEERAAADSVHGCDGCCRRLRP